MEWYIILALVIGIAIILFPIAYVWYLNMGGIYAAVRESRKRRAIGEEKTETVIPDPAARPKIREVQASSTRKPS